MKNEQFICSDLAERSFVNMKSRLASQPILNSPDYKKQFCLAVNTLQGAVG